MLDRDIRTCCKVILFATALSCIAYGNDNREALALELRAAAESGQWALAQNGNGALIIHPFGLTTEERSLKCQFLSYKFTSDGLNIGGLGTPSRRPTSAPLSALVCDRSGSVLFAFPVPANTSGISIAPNRKKVALYQDARNGIHRLRVLTLEPSADSSVVVAAIVKDVDYQIAWSPDSNQIVFSVDGEVRLFDVRTRMTSVLGTGRAPSWSPDGTWITFLSPSSHLVMFSVSSSSVAPFPRKYKSLSTAIWAPNSRWFAIREDRDYHVRNNICYSNNPLVVYRVADLAHVDVLNLCGLKPQLFGWIANWREWGSADRSR